MEKCYVIKDSNGQFGGSISIYVDLKEWCYTSEKCPIWVSTIKENVQNKVNKLNELNTLAEFPNLSWEVMEITEKQHLDMRQQLHEEHKDCHPSIIDYYNMSVELKSVEKGTLTKSRKLVNEIYKKYKLLKKNRVA